MNFGIHFKGNLISCPNSQTTKIKGNSVVLIITSSLIEDIYWEIQKYSSVDYGQNSPQHVHILLLTVNPLISPSKKFPVFRPLQMLHTFNFAILCKALIWHSGLVWIFCIFLLKIVNSRNLKYRENYGVYSTIFITSLGNFKVPKTPFQYISPQTSPTFSQGAFLYSEQTQTVCLIRTRFGERFFLVETEAKTRTGSQTDPNNQKPLLRSFAYVRNERNKLSFGIKKRNLYSEWMFVSFVHNILIANWFGIRKWCISGGFITLFAIKK